MNIPEEAKNLLEKGIVYLATSDGKNPNVTVTQSGKIIGPDEILICDCGMRLAKENIQKNRQVSLASYDEKNGIGFKGFGVATYYDSGEFLDIAKRRLEGEQYKPKGAVIIKLENIFKIE